MTDKISDCIVDSPVWRCPTDSASKGSMCATLHSLLPLIDHYMLEPRDNSCKYFLQLHWTYDPMPDCACMYTLNCACMCSCTSPGVRFSAFHCILSKIPSNDSMRRYLPPQKFCHWHCLCEVWSADSLVHSPWAEGRSKELMKYLFFLQCSAIFSF